jgi:hypothetical protein
MTTIVDGPDGHPPRPAGARYSMTNLGSGIRTWYDAEGRALGQCQRWAPVSEKDKAHARQHAPKDGPVRVTPPSPWPR